MVFEAISFDVIMRDWVKMEKRRDLKTKPWSFPVIGSKLEEEIATENEKEHDQRKTKKTIVLETK